MEHFNVEEYLVFETIAGSRLYGTNTTESDVDYRGVCLPPMEVLLNPFMSFNVKDSFEDREDRAVYDLGKFFNLCADNNPNVLELLYSPADKIVFAMPVWYKVLEFKHLFLSKNLRYRFSGFAFAQLKKTLAHKHWFTNPPTHKPTREEFGLGEVPSVSMAWLNSLKDTMNYELLKPEYAEEVKKERAYRDAKRAWDNYDKWQRERNPKRKGSEEMYGYDTKMVSHIYRLAFQGRDLLLEGEIVFPLKEAQFLLDVKNGLLKWEDVAKFVNSLDEKFNEWVSKSKLPNKPNRNELQDLYNWIVKEYGIWQNKD